jgi:hypothetical protein
LDKAQRVLTLFSQASGAKVNWHKTAAIWASKSERTWSWGEEVGLRWLPEGSGTRYLGIQVGFHLPPETNFEKMMLALKSKLITWSNNRLSLSGRILVANQVLFASTWYLAACWNPNPLMCARVRGLIRNFIWGGKDAPARAKVRWDTLVLPASQGGLGIIDPKSQSEALLAKLPIRGLASGGEPWKELIRRYADQVRLPIHGKGPPTPDINWLFAAPKLKRLGPSMWKNILGSWLSVRPGLTKSNPTSAAEILRQPIFDNPSVLNTRGIPLGLGGTRDENAFANHGCTRVKDLWCNEEKDWKSLAELGMCYHENNRKCKEEIAESIPWRPDEYALQPQPGEWIGIPNQNPPPPHLDWVYQVLKAGRGTAEAIEYQRLDSGGCIQATSQQPIQLAMSNYRQVRILTQEKPGSTFKVARDPPAPGKKPPLFWIFESGFVQDLPWDPRDWHWQAPSPLGDAPFFGYTAKRGYKNARRSSHSPSLLTFIQGLSLRNSTVNQVIARIWHNARPKKVRTLIWLTLNQGLPVGTWL